MGKERDTNIDIIKGTGIILMVGGHCGMPFTHFIYLFHMSIFFMASGFCFKSSNSDSVQSVLKFTGRKIKSLWIPYVLRTIIFTLLNNAFIKIGIYTENLVLAKQTSGVALEVTHPLSSAEIMMNIIKAMLLHGHTQLGSALWFVATLMGISLLYCVIDFIIKKNTNSVKIKLASQGAISIAMLALGYRCSLNDFVGGGINRILSCYILFYIGAVLKLVNVPKKNEDKKYFYGSLVVSFFVLLLCNQVGSIALDENQYKNPIFFLTSSICGWVFLYDIAQILKKSKCVSEFLMSCGQNSMAVVVLHFLCFKVVSLIGVMFYKQPIGYIAAFPVLYENGMWWVAYLFTGIIIPVLLSMLWKRIKAEMG